MLLWYVVELGISTRQHCVRVALIPLYPLPPPLPSPPLPSPLLPSPPLPSLTVHQKVPAMQCGLTGGIRVCVCSVHHQETNTEILRCKSAVKEVPGGMQAVLSDTELLLASLPLHPYSGMVEVRGPNLRLSDPSNTSACEDGVSALQAGSPQNRGESQSHTRGSYCYNASFGKYNAPQEWCSLSYSAPSSLFYSLLPQPPFLCLIPFPFLLCLS